MARRLLLGNDGTGAFRLRQTPPGVDAATADPKDCIFDADYQPALIMGSGTTDLTALEAPGIKSKVVAHGLGRAPDMLVAVAQTRLTSNDQPATHMGYGNGYPFWPYWGWRPSPLAPENRLDFIGPYYFTVSAAGSGGSGAHYYGWWYEADASNLTFYSTHCGYSFIDPDQTSGQGLPSYLHIRWTALRLS